ncbi:uncharacterized protein LOC116843954 isoform X2 [Odontomachus brunneus]|uniref:uncharacterized protein LOC116843954 isoform X2 n=1 Tax=Odontomachus brunneus TaxID=486640 RepID=UPI0013F185CD|nr:uncharacterized protein LOC116843954 isoform X2 [Odontomachus brunneus]
MFRKTIILIIAISLAINYVSCKRMNLTQLIKDSFRRQPQLYNQYSLRDGQLRGFSYLSEDDYNEAMENEDKLQQLNRDNRNLMIQYNDLCKTKVTKIDLMDDPVYDYQPSHYFEISCEGFDDNEAIMGERPQQKCAYPGFHCVQRSRQLFLSRRRWESECWEPHMMEIKSDCDCMWPATLSDIRDHY